MPLNIVLEVSDEDLKYFSRVLESVWKKTSKKPERELIDGARKLIKQAHKAKAPSYITQRLADIGMLIDVLDDKEWALEAEDRRRVLAAVSYFAVPKDMISDKIPGIGYLDDALVADLVLRELKHDLEGYTDFRAYRDNEAKVRGKKVDKDDWLASKRSQLVDRIHRRREQALRRNRQNRITHPILQFKY